MLVLGIETSCDETAIAVVEKGRRIRSNIIASSLSFHKRYGGVIPEIASRKHLETISWVLKEAIAKGRVGLEDIGLIAVTKEPGLFGSLLVGLCFARALSFAQNTPLIEINHLHAHLAAVFFNKVLPCFPFIGLVISGGHTSLFYVKSFQRIEQLGTTLDDASGEAFDKVAKILGLGYPGGPLIEKLAEKGDPGKIRFSCSNTKEPLDFSFSGIKTAVLYYVGRHASCAMRHRIRRKTHNAKRTTQIADIAASFQEAVIDTLINKSFLACRIRGVNQLVIGGGVAANNRLRNRFNIEAKNKGINLYFPSTQLCTDNAAMVAGLGYQMRR